MAKLTIKGIEAIRPGKARREIPDALLPGLYFIVQPSGAKSWAVRYRHGGRTRKYTIGPHPLFDLKAAREAGTKALRTAAEGRDPAAEKRRTDTDSVAAAVTQFIERYCKRNYRPQPLRGTVRLLEAHVLARWRDRKIDDITRADVRDMLERIKAPILANRVHAIVRKLFNWSVENDIIANSPVAGIKQPSIETARDRVLTDDELRLVWQAAEKIGPPVGSMVQLLILTGQRRGEVAGMEWAELDLEAGLWTLPAGRVKNGRRHEVPLSRQAMAIVKRLPHISDCLVFSLNGLAQFGSFSRYKRHVDTLVNIPPWVVHDLRRTAASGMARLGTSLPVIEKVLNHSSGSFAGIVGVYQRHEFADEKRQALQRWADYVERLVVERRRDVITPMQRRV
jgi:integrase